MGIRRLLAGRLRAEEARDEPARAAALEKLNRLNLQEKIKFHFWEFVWVCNALLLNLQEM